MIDICRMFQDAEMHKTRAVCENIYKISILTYIENFNVTFAEIKSDKIASEGNNEKNKKIDSVDSTRK